MAQTQNPGKVRTSVYKGFWRVIPEKVLAKLGFTSVKQQEPTDISPDSLTATVLESKVEQEQINERLKTTTTLGGTSASFSGHELTRELQDAVVTETFSDLGSLALSPTSTTVSGSIEDLGNGKGFLRQVDTATLLPLAEYTAEKRRLLPELFFATVADTTIETTSAGTAAMPTLSGLQLRVNDRQIDAFNHRVSTKTSGNVANDTTFTGQEWTDQYGGGVILHEQSKRDDSALTLDFRTVSAKADPLGDGTFFVDERKLSNVDDWPTLAEDIWDALAAEFIHVTKQVVEQGSTSPGLSAGVLTEVRAIDNLHELKLTSTYVSAPIDQSLPVIVEIGTPNWFTFDPIVVSASSGYTADQGETYSVASKRGHFAGVLHRKFSNTIPSAPVGTLLQFLSSASQTDTAYENIGDQPYCRILRFNVPEHIDAEPVGDFIVSLQTQFHRCGWVQEYVEVTL